MKLTRKLTSYLVPLMEKYASVYNGEMEVTMVDGRKVLDSANANYSYGSLQRILKFALEKGFSPDMETVLLLGLGGGSVLQTLKFDFKFKGTVTAVDIDPVIIQIARDEFGITPSEKLRIVCEDALDFVKNDPDTYDLIIVDLFIDTQLPRQFLSAGFWQHVRQRSHEGSNLIFNTFSGTNHASLVKSQLIRQGFAVEVYPKVERTNTVLIAHRNG